MAKKTGVVEVTEVTGDGCILITVYNASSGKKRAPTCGQNPWISRGGGPLRRKPTRAKCDGCKSCPSGS